jgi:branched-chain amino acid transport system permease protein
VIESLAGPLLGQLLNALAGASSLFLVAAGLSLIFGVCRVVNFAHGSFYMLGLYLAFSLVEAAPSVFGPGSVLGFWLAVLGAAVAVGLLGAVAEVLVLRRLYRSPELFQLLATFALVLIIKDMALWAWGPEDLLGPRAPGLSGAVTLMGRAFPVYDLVLMAIGPLVLGLLWLLLNRTRYGVLMRAATLDRDMVGALGVNPAWLFTATFALGSALAGLGGALQLPREPAHLGIDLLVIGEAFVVVVVGGLGSVTGAFLAALLIALVKALCISVGTVELWGTAVAFSKFTLVVEFVVMALVLAVRPWGLLGRAQAAARDAVAHPPLPASPRPWRTLGLAAGLVVVLALVPWASGPGVLDQPYAPILMVDLLTAALFAASLHWLLGPAGLHSFGHAAYFGLGAYAAALVATRLAWPMEAALALAPLVAGLGALACGWFITRLQGVYLAMLTLAFAQIVWSVAFQWDEFTGGSNGINGVWPSLSVGQWAAAPGAFFALVLGCVAAGVALLWWVVHAPLGYAIRAGRDAPRRAEASGLPTVRLQWTAFVMAGALAGLAGGLFAFSKGSISPEGLAVGRSVDGLVMVLLGGLQSMAGPLLGAAVFTGLQDWVARETDYWRAVLGGILLLLVLVLPGGLAGARQWVRRSVSASGHANKGAAA